MNLATFRLFRDIARTRSFTHGAEAGNISQSAASQAIRSLEEELGCGLIDRTKRPFRLTSEGETFAEGVRRILEDFERLRERLRGGRSDVAGTVRVAAIYSVGLLDMARHIRVFQERHPRARVRVEYLRPDKVVASVVEGGADIGILSYPSPGRRLEVIPLREEEMVLAVPARHPLARRRRIRPRDLAGVPFIAFDSDLPIRREIDRALARHRIDVEVVMEFDNIGTIKDAVAGGAGAAILPLPTLRAEIQRHEIAAVPLAFERLKRPLGMILRRGARPGPAVSAFVGLLREE